MTRKPSPDPFLGREGEPPPPVPLLTKEGLGEVSSSAAVPLSAPPARLPVIAIVGPPNAGKSTLFNRLVRTQRAIVDSQPGITRDRNMATGEWGGRRFLLIDTGGFEEKETSSLASAVRAQSALAAEEADAVLALFDGRAGVSPMDRDLVRRLRGLRKPVLYAVNKLDGPGRDDEAADFFALGLPRVFPISAAHGRGIGELMEELLRQLPEPVADVESAPPEALTLAIVGRPNVGKSSLVNRLLGFERAIVDATPGTTRDTLDTPFRHGERQYVLVDTAGIRRRPRVHEQIERASVARALRAVERAEIALLVLDGTQEVADQDVRIAGQVWERGRGLLFVVNKWDAVPRAERKQARALTTIRERYVTLAEVPAVCLSARTGEGVDALFPALEQLVAAHRRQMRTVHLNEVLKQATEAQAPPSVQGKRPRFLYATQTGTAPPVITIFCHAPELVQVSYERYLANAFRQAFELYGTPLRLQFKKSPTPEGRRPQVKPGPPKRRPRPSGGRGRGPRRAR